MKRLLAIILVLCLTLTGCDSVDVGGFLEKLQFTLSPQDTTHFRDMVYTRPDMEALEQAMQDACDAAQITQPVRHVLHQIYVFYDAYDQFYTAYTLADIHYSLDLSDPYWEAEYNFCASHTSEADALLDKLYYALAASHFRDTLEGEEFFGAGFFDSYEGESMWTEEFTALMTRESDLISRYYDLSGQDSSDAVRRETEELYVELVKTRNEIAAMAGYDSYVDFAYDYYYTRDYTAAQVMDYLGEIQRDLVPLYRDAEIRFTGGDYCREQDALRYVSSAAYATGGIVQEAFQTMTSAGLYDISPGANKYDSCFETYIYSYDCPFVFVNPAMNQWDKLSFAHEFGHFANDYACGGSDATIDVAEFFSQGFEYLSLCQGADAWKLTPMKMMDSLCIFVEQSAYTAFEHQVYALPDSQLTTDGIGELFRQVCTDYGFDSLGFDYRDYIYINHFFTNPLYTISYVISNDAALQLYQLEQREAGAGFRLYLEVLDRSDLCFLAFVEEAGLENPFSPGRTATIRDTLKDALF